MGHAANRENVLLCLTALEQTLAAMAAPIQRDRALAAAKAAYC
jgi:alanine-glyoxylate transaminase/serine-glyoxylate transaminase/serine-pyruvate transaminase